jgi:TonB family protein
VLNLRDHLLYRVGAVLLLVVPIAAYGSVSDADLEKEYGNKILTLRQFQPGSHLHFDNTGNPAGKVASSAWTVDGQLRVQHISLKDGVVHIQGQRLFYFYDLETKRLQDVSAVTKNDKFSKHFKKWATKAGKTEIDVACGEPQPGMPDVIKTMNTVFLSPDEPLTDVVPDYWKTWLEAHGEKGGTANPTGYGQGEGQHVGGSVSAPRAIYAPDPEYSEAARQAWYQATTVLWLIVTPEGFPKDIRIAKPAGLGLDEEAVRTVQRWKFDPAKKDGQPVAVQINVEVNFRLY